MIDHLQTMETYVDLKGYSKMVDIRSQHRNFT